MFEEGAEYGLTLNPDEDFRRILSEDQFPLAYTYILKWLLELKNILPYIRLYPEYAVGRCNSDNKGSLPRLHLHGMSKLDVFRYYTYGCTKMDKHFKYKFVNNTEDCETYFKKNEKTMKQWCKNYDLPYEITWKSLKKHELSILSWYKRGVELRARRS